MKQIFVLGADGENFVVQTKLARIHLNSAVCWWKSVKQDSPFTKQFRNNQGCKVRHSFSFQQHCFGNFFLESVSGGGVVLVTRKS